MLKISTESIRAVWSDIPRATRIALGVAILVVAAGAVYAVVDSGTVSTTDAQREAEELIATVGELMVLPDEEPIIVTVSNPEEFAGQPYFSGAQVGDSVLIYNIARKAILYRASEDRVVDIAPLSPLP